MPIQWHDVGFLKLLIYPIAIIYRDIEVFLFHCLPSCACLTSGVVKARQPS